jgi:hypothetical protein
MFTRVLPRVRGLLNGLPNGLAEGYRWVSPKTAYCRRGEHMAGSRKVQLYKYVKVNGRWKYCKAVFYENNRLKPHAVLIGGVEQTIKDGTYCLSYGRGWENVGGDPSEALKALLRKRGELVAVANGGSVVAATTPTSLTLVAAFEQWVQEDVDKGRDKETLRAKRLIGTWFMQSCKVKKLSLVTEDSLLIVPSRYNDPFGGVTCKACIAAMDKEPKVRCECPDNKHAPTGCTNDAELPVAEKQVCKTCVQCYLDDKDYHNV